MIDKEVLRGACERFWSRGHRIVGRWWAVLKLEIEKIVVLREKAVSPVAGRTYYIVVVVARGGQGCVSNDKYIPFNFKFPSKCPH
jgi:hypothetical protein